MNMTDTKECPNCGKWMIKWDRNDGWSFGYQRDMIQKTWKCYCGHEENRDEKQHPDDYSTHFNRLWKEANKGEK